MQAKKGNKIDWIKVHKTSEFDSSPTKKKNHDCDAIGENCACISAYMCVLSVKFSYIFYCVTYWLKEVFQCKSLKENLSERLQNSEDVFHIASRNMSACVDILEKYFILKNKFSYFWWILNICLVQCSVLKLTSPT